MSLSRPSDHFDSEAPVQQPKLGFVGSLRFFWRQLTSMRTALFLLLLLAFAAIPGSLVPQVTADPNGVRAYEIEYPDLYPVLNALGVFNTYGSVWFSAIYLLLFISLIGCIIPRARHHWAALRARPPRTPARLERMAGFTSASGDADVAASVSSANAQLRRLGYRTEQFGDSISAERGYLRETGNLVFHMALVGILVAIGVGGGYGFSGQRIIVEGSKFVNVQGDYDSINPGRFVDSDSLQPYRIVLDDFDVTYETRNLSAIGQPSNFTASVTTTNADGSTDAATIKVNEPLAIGGTEVFLLGNGYAPTVTVRDPEGEVVWTDDVPFLPQDNNLTSQGVIKVPDGLAEQVGMIGFFYPTVAELDSGALASSFPDLNDPLLSLQVYTGDLGIDDGVPKSVYTLNVDDLEQVAGREDALRIAPGETVDLPNGLGTIELSADVKRFISIDVHHDPSQVWVLLFAVLVIGGLLTGLFVPRRRLWVKATRGDGGDIRIEYAGLARGEDPGLEAAVADFAAKHSGSLGLKVDS